MTEENRKRIAFHECGHAVVCLAMKKKFTEINLTQNGFEYGHFKGHTFDRTNADIAEEIRSTVLILLGGHMADAIHLDRDPGELMNSVDNGSEKDVEKIRDIVEVLKLDERQGAEMFRDSSIEAARILQRLWPIVTRMAEALVSSGRLSYDECVRIAA